MNKAAYIHQPGVEIDPQKVPETLRRLVSIAEEWAMVGETATLRKVDRSSTEDLERFVQEFQKEMSEISSFCFGTESSKSPIPDEVALFQIALTSFREADSLLRLRKMKAENRKSGQ